MNSLNDRSLHNLQACSASLLYAPCRFGLVVSYAAMSVFSLDLISSAFVFLRRKDAPPLSCQTLATVWQLTLGWDWFVLVLAPILRSLDT